ncbi:MAG: 3-phosphoshikimate 1-carboxyvinyltransferase, partial [Lachnospiraceae bacterium]|nr:3-phosphoshikimate 1-carboxyvinyltransferase [Lachnospiraceae bacterium]
MQNKLIEYLVPYHPEPVNGTVVIPGSKSITNRLLFLAALTDGDVLIKGIQRGDDSVHFMDSMEKLGVRCEVVPSQAERKPSSVQGIRAQGDGPCESPDGDGCCGCSGDSLCGSGGGGSGDGHCGSGGGSRGDGQCGSDVDAGGDACTETLGDVCSPCGSQSVDVLVHGCGGRFPSKASIDVGSGGTGARFITSALALSDGVYQVYCSEQMKKRPMDELFRALRSLGAEVICLSSDGHLPAEIRGKSSGEKLEVTIDTDTSTQFLSALLLSSPLVPGGIDIHVTGSRKSGSYVGITMDCLRSFGVKSSFDKTSSIYKVQQGDNIPVSPGEIRCEPDMSAACYFFAAAAVTGGSVTVKGTRADSVQGDIRFLKDVLIPMGCTMSEGNEGMTVTGPSGGRLKGIDIDMQDFSDQVLTLAAIAPWADGTVSIRNVGHIRKQECDRAEAVKDCLGRAGILCDIQGDDLIIHPGETKACRIDTREDHRVAMSMSLLGLRTKGVIIEDPGCCKKTFPGYFEALETLI